MASRIGIGVCIALIAVAACGYTFLRLAERKIADRMRPPILMAPTHKGSDFSFQTLDGTPEHLSDLKGKVVLVDLWGTWCIQCVVEMPRLQQLYTHFRNAPDVKFLAISRMDTPDRVRAYARRNGYDLPFYTMADADIPANMQFNQFPSTFLFAKDGSLVAEHAGAADWADPSVIAAIQELRGR